MGIGRKQTKNKNWPQMNGTEIRMDEIKKMNAKKKMNRLRMGENGRE